jgi:hypothetical protein
MKQVEHYLRQAKAARDLAATANSPEVRSQIQQIAETWETLAKERLAVLQLKLEKFGGDALLSATETPASATKTDSDGNPSP